MDKLQRQLGWSFLFLGCGWRGWVVDSSQNMHTNRTKNTALKTNTISAFRRLSRICPRCVPIGQWLPRKELCRCLSQPVTRWASTLWFGVQSVCLTTRSRFYSLACPPTVGVRAVGFLTVCLSCVFVFFMTVSKLLQVRKLAVEESSQRFATSCLRQKH